MCHISRMQSNLKTLSCYLTNSNSNTRDMSQSECLENASENSQVVLPLSSGSNDRYQKIFLLFSRIVLSSQPPCLRLYLSHF